LNETVLRPGLQRSSDTIAGLDGTDRGKREGKEKEGKGEEERKMEGKRRR